MKPIRVVLLDEAEKEFKSLNEIVGLQIKNGKESTEEIQLLKSIKQKIDFIKSNPFYGDQKNNVPPYSKEYVLISTYFLDAQSVHTIKGVFFKHFDIISKNI